MDQLVCVVRRGSSFCLLQTGPFVLRLPQFDFPFTISGPETTECLKFDENLIVAVLQQKLSPEAVFCSIIRLKTAILPSTKKRLFAVYVLVDINLASRLKPTEDGDWLWQTSRNLVEKRDTGRLAKSDLETIQRVESQCVGADLSVVDYSNILKAWSKEEIENSFNYSEAKLLSVAKYDDKTMLLYAQLFIEFAFPGESLSLEQFAKILLKIGYPDVSTKSPRFFSLFRAFDERNERRLSFNNFVLGFAAMEPHTIHGGDAGDSRCRYMFRYYCQKPDFNMAYGEFIQMVDDICVARVPNVNLREQEKNKLISHFSNNFSMLQFIEKVGSLQMRGTSSLFRASFSIKEKLRLMYDKRETVDVGVSTADEIAQSAENIGRKPETADFSTQCNISLVDIPASRYALSKHVLKVTSFGRVEEVIRNIPNGVSCSYEADENSQPTAGTSTINYLSMANEVLLGLDYFHKSYVENGVKKHSFNWSRVDMTELASFVLHLCTAVCQIFAKENRCLDLDDPVYVLGDLHGNFADLKEFEQKLWPLGPSFCPAKLLFLGDYVDRGEFGIETVLYLFAQKIIAPDRIFLLRGNHELRSSQHEFTFYKECLDRFPVPFGRNVFDAINSCFDVLPFAAIINKKVFCIHGGIPHPSLTDTGIREAINKIPSPVTFVGNCTSLLAWELIWNDPVWDDSNVKLDKDGFGNNKPRKTGHVFSGIALQQFLNLHNLSHVIRAHNVHIGGFNVRYNSKLITVFSSSSYCDMENNAACVLLERGQMRLMQMGRDVCKEQLQLRYSST